MGNLNVSEKTKIEAIDICPDCGDDLEVPGYHWNKCYCASCDKIWKFG